MLVLNRFDPVGRQTLVDHAVFARAALVGVYESSPEVLGVINVERWQAAQQRANRVLAGFHQARAALPWGEQLARRLSSRWEEAAGWSLWFRVAAYDVAEAAAYEALCALPSGRCGPAEDRRVAQLMTAALNHTSTWPRAAAPPDHL